MEIIAIKIKINRSKPRRHSSTFWTYPSYDLNMGQFLEFYQENQIINCIRRNSLEYLKVNRNHLTLFTFTLLGCLHI